MHGDGLAGPEGLSVGGRSLVDSLSLPDDPYPLTALIAEAARQKDRLDQLHRLLTGDDDVWFRLTPSRGNAEVLEVKVDSAAQEARQLATVFRQTLVEIERRRGGASEPRDDDDLANL